MLATLEDQRLESVGRYGMEIGHGARPISRYKYQETRDGMNDEVVGNSSVRQQIEAAQPKFVCRQGCLVVPDSERHGGK